MGEEEEEGDVKLLMEKKEGGQRWVDEVRTHTQKKKQFSSLI